MEGSETTLFESVIPLARFKSKSKKTGKVSEQLCTLNNYSRWGRFGKSEIMTNYKQLLRDFFIPEPEIDEPYRHITLEYRIMRHNKRKIDADNLIYNHKWLSDLMQDMGWIVDDDQVTLTIRPSIVVAGIKETQFKVKAIHIAES